MVYYNQFMRTRCADEVLTMKNGELLKTEPNPALIE